MNWETPIKENLFWGGSLEFGVSVHYHHGEKGWWRAWRCSGRQVLAPSWSEGKRKWFQTLVGILSTYETSKPTPQWHMSSNMTAPIPTKPCIIIVPFPMSFWGPVTVKLSHYGKKIQDRKLHSSMCRIKIMSSVLDVQNLPITELKNPWILEFKFPPISGLIPSSGLEISSISTQEFSILHSLSPKTRYNSPLSHFKQRQPTLCLFPN